jgi:glycosyltransferase involved in cell wall biosynthesis
MFFKKNFLHYFLYIFILLGLNQNNVSFADTDEVNILMPVYNRQAYLHNTLNSVIKQTHGKKITLFILDDNSNDGSREKVENILQNQNNINYKLLYHHENNGIAQTRIDLFNRAKSISPNAYILWLDSDDQFTDKEFVSKFVHLMNETKADICLFNFVIEYENEENGIKNAQGLLQEKVTSEELLDYIYNSPNKVLAPKDIKNLLTFTSLGWTKGYAPNVILFEPANKNYEDFVYMANLISAQKITAFPSNYKPIKYLRHDISINGQRNVKTFSDVISQLEKFKSYISISNQQKFKSEIHDFLNRKLQQYRLLLVNLVDTLDHPDITKEVLDNYNMQAQQLLLN